MEMKKDPSTNSAPTKGLTAKHFAILFEGAWLFTPDPNDPTEIIATCPFVQDPTHECTFGLWGGDDRAIIPLSSMKGTMREREHYRVTTEGFGPSAASFGNLFDDAASKYPLVYMPNRPKGSAKQPEVSFTIADKSKHQKMRQVHIPLPTSVRAEGAMVTAEIGGLGVVDVCKPSQNVKRPCVTFLFIYEYTGASASVTVHAQKKNATITADYQQPTPHLIFNVRPKPTVMMPESGPAMDASARMVHTVSTFEMMRLSVLKITGGSGASAGKPSLCNIALYHGRGEAVFSLLDSGLSLRELGLQRVGDVARDTDLASCAAGALAAG
jgi:hypothetical protein